MAGDWLKMRSNLWDDPRVARLCDLTGAKEATIIGALYWLWAAADQHSETGHLPGLTHKQIDRKTSVRGFADALCEVGWLIDDPRGVVIPKFAEHNGTSAKRRASEAQRKATGRKTSASDADKERTESAENGTSCGAREEKRREEKEEEKTEESPREGTEAQPYEVAVDMVLDAFTEDLRPHSGIIARWIDQLSEARRDPNPIPAAEIIREIVWKNPTKPPEYIGKCVGTAATEALSAPKGTYDHRRANRRETPTATHPGAADRERALREKFPTRSVAELLAEQG